MFYYFKTTRAKVYLIFVFLIAKDDFLSPRVFLFYPNVSRVYLALKMIFTTDHGWMNEFVFQKHWHLENKAEENLLKTEQAGYTGTHWNIFYKDKTFEIVLEW